MVIGLPVTRILEVAEKLKPMMVVVGSQGRTGMKQMIIGSKAAQIVQLCPFPVTVVKRKKGRRKSEAVCDPVFELRPMSVTKSQPSFFVALAVFLCCSPAFAAGDSTSAMAVGPMAIGLFGGLALFLFGIDQMTESLKAVAGDRMRAFLPS